MFADACLNDPDKDPAGGLPMHHESMRTHRPILNLLFDSLVGVEFGSAQDQDEWSLYLSGSDFVIQNGDFELARMVGRRGADRLAKPFETRVQDGEARGARVPWRCLCDRLAADAGE